LKDDITKNGVRVLAKVLLTPQQLWC
jgi:hypothetical protein